MNIPAITTRQMIEVDRLMIEEFNILLIQMMENAGRQLAELARQMAGGQVHGKSIAVYCGAGNNGGGGLVAARHLHNWGAKIWLKVRRSKDPNSTQAHQQRILERMGISDQDEIDLQAADLVIDAMIGYGISGDPRGTIAQWIEDINHANRPVLALDTPSGLDLTPGTPGNPCIRADVTLTLALPKTGLLSPEASAYVGELYLADISIPPKLYTEIGIELDPPFTHHTIIKI